MAKTSPGLFFRQVRQEVGKVTWPTRKEASLSTVTVIIMTTMAATFFFFVDQFFAWVIKLIFGLGG